jgi:hypothetical protein
VYGLADLITVRPVPFDRPPATALGQAQLRTRSGAVVDAVAARTGHVDHDAVAVEKFVANAGDGERSRALARSVLEDGWRNP